MLCHKDYYLWAAYTAYVISLEASLQEVPNLITNPTQYRKIYQAGFDPSY
jgi:hypothetical protein